jgi:hypothetical protein
MDLTTGSILRQILRCDLSVSAHKLATIILDGIAWKDGYNGLDRGTAAFTLSTLSEIMGVTRQHLTTLLAELAASEAQRQVRAVALPLWLRRRRVATASGVNWGRHITI